MDMKISPSAQTASRADDCTAHGRATDARTEAKVLILCGISGGRVLAQDEVGDAGYMGHRLDAVLKSCQLHRAAPLYEHPIEVHQISVGRGVQVLGFGRIHNQLPSSVFDEIGDIDGKGAEQRVFEPIIGKQ